MKVLSRRDYLSTPLFGGSIKVLLLGGGELGKEIAIEAQRLGLEVVVVDRYDWAPAMHVAHRRYVVDMMNPEAIKAVIEHEKPDLIVPEIEAIATSALEELEERGYNVVPNARAVKIAMNRIELREFAVKTLGLPTARYAIAENEEEAHEACEKVGYPCLLKPEMSSSGLGHVRVSEPKRELVAQAYRYAIAHARGKSKKVIVEEFLKLSAEFTILAYRYVSENGRVVTEACEPVEHWRYGQYHYIESWQPSERSPKVLEVAKSMGLKVAEGLGGLGIYGVEIFLTEDGRILFSEVAPRPHDTGMVTMASQDLSEFAIHIRASLGLPVPKPKLLTPAASLAVYADKDNLWAYKLAGVYEALNIPGVDIRFFGKPYTYSGRRVAVILARGSNVQEALEKARRAASALRVVS
ncbi:MAG: formate-dependent phosphoribosylglycinamide formyltransferase [Acidilobaceae archaeon]